MSRSALLFLIAGAFALGIFLGAGIGIFSPYPWSKSDRLRAGKEGDFRFIRSSLASVDRDERAASNELKPFRYRVNELIERRLQSRDADAVSVYFRDLNNGNWFGISEKERFLQKGLLKVPLMIAYFKWAETNPFVLRKEFAYHGTEDRGGPSTARPGRRLEPGLSYTVNDLIFRMIAYDDTAAFSLLNANLPESRFDKTFRELSVEYDPHKPADSLSLSSFAAFYRVLFNASYLSEEMSEKALRYLSQSTFREGMAAGIPPDIDIAGKHGERAVSTTPDDEAREMVYLHEIGIVYCPNRPFLLGVMTRGPEVEKLKKIIREITRLVYEEVSRQS